MPDLLPTEAPKLYLVVKILLPVNEEPGRMILRKRGKKQALRDSTTLRSYGIVDGPTLDFEVIGLETG